MNQQLIARVMELRKGGMSTKTVARTLRIRPATVVMVNKLMTSQWESLRDDFIRGAYAPGASQP